MYREVFNGSVTHGTVKPENYAGVKSCGFNPFLKYMRNEKALKCKPSALIFGRGALKSFCTCAMI